MSEHYSFHNFEMFRPTRKDSARKIARALKQQNRRQINIEFLPFENNPQEHLNVNQVYNWIMTLKQNGIAACRPANQILPDTRMHELLKNWEQRRVLADRRDVKTPLISIIIPSYRNKNFLIALLRHLDYQSLPSDQFEVLVMDDGSDDGSFSAVQAELVRRRSKLSWLYAYCPRQMSRQRMDSTFRAGWLRNWGAELARGQELLFLDSDILVAPQFLELLLKRKTERDVIQNVRIHIPSAESHEAVEFAKSIDSKTNYIEEAKYWRPFFETKDWMQIPNFWKYTCSYCLCVSKKAFQQIEGFQKNFIFYGFEDTDLGYRLAKCGYQFKLHQDPVLHLTPAAHESEFHHSSWRRHQLLSRSAQMFFLLNLDPHIYNLLRIYMG